jgi:hypothetical protein
MQTRQLTSRVAPPAPRTIRWFGEEKGYACRIARCRLITRRSGYRSSIGRKVVSGHAYAIPAPLPVQVVRADMTPT